MTQHKHTVLGLALAAALAATGFGGASAAQAAVKHYEGTVVSVDRVDGSFRLRDSERGTVRINIKSSTRFERIAGLDALKAGMKRVEATVRRSAGAWVATKVERSGAGGRHGGADDGARGGADDGGSRHDGADDGAPGGADDGGTRHDGADDGARGGADDGGSRHDGTDDGGRGGA
jgi:hypothetical protein